MDISTAIDTRRSIRAFTDEKISDKQIDSLLEAARIAPSWANTQCWEFIVVRDREKIEQVTQTYSSSNPARKCSSTADALIVCCFAKNKSGTKKGEPMTEVEGWPMFDLGLAVQNIALKAHSLGLGTVVVGALDHAECAKILEVPSTVQTVCVLPIGVPAVQNPPAPRRKQIPDFVFLNKYADNYQPTDA